MITKALFGVGLLLCAASASASLSFVSGGAASSEATALRADIGDNFADALPASFTSGGVTYNRIFSFTPWDLGVGQVITVESIFTEARLHNVLNVDLDADLTTAGTQVLDFPSGNGTLFEKTKISSDSLDTVYFDFESTDGPAEAALFGSLNEDNLLAYTDPTGSRVVAFFDDLRFNDDDNHDDGVALIQINPVPEPATIVSVIAVLFLLLGSLRARSKKKN